MLRGFLPFGGRRQNLIITLCHIILGGADDGAQIRSQWLPLAKVATAGDICRFNHDPCGGDFSLSYFEAAWHAAHMARDSKWREKALAIEFWIATAIVGGSFVVGLLSGIRSLFAI